MNTWYCIRRTSAVAAAAAALAAGEATPTEAEVWIYGDIGESWYGETVAAKDFVKELAALDAEKIKLRINSYGGSVSDGLAIYNALKRHPASIHATVDGIAASIASLIFMAADEREIADNAQLMIHAPWAYVAGNSAELREFADRLDLWAKSMASSYSAATGMTEDEVMAWLTDGKDHYFTAAEAVAQKLATTTASAMPVAASATRHAWATRKPPLPVQTPAPAAANAANTTHPTQNAVPAAANPEPSMTPEQAAAIKAAAKAENDRQAAIRAAFQPHLTRTGALAALDAAVADLDCDVVKAKAKLLDVLAVGSTPSGSGHVVTLEDESDKRKKALASAVEIRAGVAKNDTANPYRGHTLVEVARASLAMAGVKTDGLDKMGMIALAFTHSTGDFPLLLSGVAQKAMLKGYDEAEETFQLWTSKGTLPDFKPMTNVDIGSFPSLRRVREGGEYKYITVGERAETRVLATYGELFKITRQAVINDDLDAFTRIPKKMGRAAIRTVGDLAYTVLTGNANMADGVALFHATHSNLAATTAISTASVDAMRVAMGKQKDIGQTSGSLNIRLAHLIVPMSLEGTANVVRESEYEVGAAKNNTVPNSVRNTFDVISDARLDDANPAIWYGAANAGMHDVVQVDYLDGNEKPTMEQQAGWTVDGVEFKVRIDASAKAMDWKTLQRNG